MAKQILLLVFLTTLISWFRLIYGFFLNVIWTIYHFCTSKLDAIFAGGTIGTFFKNAISLLIVSALAATIPSLLTQIIFRRNVLNFKENLSVFLVLCSASIALNSTHAVTKITS